MEQELMVDSLEEFRTEGNFNWYDNNHIDRIRSLIDIKELQKLVDLQIMNMEAQQGKWDGIPKEIIDKCEEIENLEELKGRIQRGNPWIKVR